jgi:hypothetical protein
VVWTCIIAVWRAIAVTVRLILMATTNSGYELVGIIGALVALAGTEAIAIDVDIEDLIANNLGHQLKRLGRHPKHGSGNPASVENN